MDYTDRLNVRLNMLTNTFSSFVSPTSNSPLKHSPTCLNFCGKYLFDYKHQENWYIPCVPRPASRKKDRNYPDGRYHGHTPQHKDKWIEDFIVPYIQSRIEIETDEKNIDNGVDEYGRPGETAVHFYQMADCANAYSAFMCWVNFPRCDMEKNETMPMCRSACENMFMVCGFSEDMWRCGSAELMNALKWRNRVVLVLQQFLMKKVLK